MATPKPSIFSCALMILNNQCPPDNTAYLCAHGEEADEDCVRCWGNYLFYVANGFQRHPYQYDRDQQKQLEERKV